MRIRNVVAVILTAIVFLSAAALGVSNVYRVDAVTLDVSVISDAAREEADALQKNLLGRYEKDSIFFASEREAEEEFAAFPYFRMVSFRKEYPNRLVISASEDAEVFAAAREDGSYYILDPASVAQTVNAYCNPYTRDVTVDDLSIRTG